MSSDEWRAIVEHFQQGLMKTRARGVLPKHPGIGVADFLDLMRCQSDKVGIPLGRSSVASRHTFAHLDESMLNVPRMHIVAQILGDLLIREMTAEPGIPPEQERHKDDEPSRDQEQNSVARGH